MKKRKQVERMNNEMVDKVFEGAGRQMSRLPRMERPLFPVDNTDAFSPKESKRETLSFIPSPPVSCARRSTAT
jgi:hypothetical protein